MKFIEYLKTALLVLLIFPTFSYSSQLISNLPATAQCVGVVTQDTTESNMRQDYSSGYKITAVDITPGSNGNITITKSDTFSPYGFPTQTYLTWTATADSFFYWDSVLLAWVGAPGTLFNSSNDIFDDSLLTYIATGLYAQGTDVYYAVNNVGNLPDCIPDPCNDDVAASIDDDGDGICNRCDFYPTEPQYGRNFYGYFGDTNDGFLTRINGYFKPYSVLSSSGVDTSDHWVDYTTPDHDPSTSEPTNYDGAIVGQMSECGCGQPCEMIWNQPTPDSPTPPPPEQQPWPDSGDGGIVPLPSPYNLGVPDLTLPAPRINPELPAGKSFVTGQPDNAHLEDISQNAFYNVIATNEQTKVLDELLTDLKNSNVQGNANIVNELSQINDSIPDLTEDKIEQSDIDNSTSGLDSALDGQAQSIQDGITGAVTDIENNNPMPDTELNLVQSIYQGLFPSYGTCQPLTLTVQTWTKEIGCEQADKVKSLMKWLLYMLTVHQLFMLMLSGAKPPEKA